MPVSAIESLAGADDYAVVLFDAECVLCSANARFILQHDGKACFRLAAMQGEAGAAIFRQHGMDPADPDSILLIEGNQVRKDSDAVLRIYELLGLPWRLAGALRVIPAALRDPAYRWIARNRYRLFGKRDSCWVAPPEFRDRLL